MNFGGTIRLNRTGWLLVALVGVIILFIHFSRSKYSNEEAEENMVNLKSLLIGAIEATQLGGKKVIAGTKEELHVKSKGKTQEGANDPVTDADFASHCEMYYSLSRAFPGVHIRSEEEAAGPTSCPTASILPLALAEPALFPSIADLGSVFVHPGDVSIWIDPLDATKEFTEGLYQYVTTMVCVAVKGVPIIGVIHQPKVGNTSWAWVAQQLSPDLLAPSRAPEGGPRVLLSMSHQGPVKTLATRAFGHGADITTAAGAGYKVLELAHGRADLYLHSTSIKKWDICAGNAILNALGGRMTTLKNQTLDYSYDGPEINKDGLVATVLNHNSYITKLSAAAAAPEASS